MVSYPKVTRTYLYGFYNLPINQENDIKRFNNLNDLYIDLRCCTNATPANFRKIMVDNSALAYIHQTVPSYEIMFDTERG